MTQKKKGNKQLHKLISMHIHAKYLYRKEFGFVLLHNSATV